MSCLLATWVAVLLWLLWPVTRLAAYKDVGSVAETPAAIINLELAFTAKQANTIVGAWRAGQSPVCAAATGTYRPAPGHLRDCPARGLNRDRWLMLGYMLLGFMTFRATARCLGDPDHSFWWRLAKLSLAAGLADFSVDFCLRQILAAQTAAPFWVGCAGFLAVIKFALLALMLIAAVSVLAFYLWSRPWERIVHRTWRWLRSRTGPGAHAHDGHSGCRPVRLPKVIADERAYLLSRRRKAGLLKADDDLPPIGLALSGGGIRSATLCLGVLQALGQSGLWRRIDYLSTVSGGGYIGSTLSTLLSCKACTRWEWVTDQTEYQRQFEFGRHDRPHFGVTQPEDSPFHDTEDPAQAAHRDWLNGRTVVAHLRAFGDYLVRRRRLLDRDVLRALGTVLTGSLVSLVLIAGLTVVAAALVLATLALAGGELVPKVKDVPSGYLGHLITGAGGWLGLGWAAGLGALFAIGAIVCGFCAYRTPKHWFVRDGDSFADAKERRSLWVFGGLVLVGAWATPGFLAPLIPDLGNALLLPVAFLGTSLLASILVYVLLGARPLLPLLKFERINRSYHSAIVALLLYFTLAAAALVAATAILGRFDVAQTGSDRPGWTGGAVAVGAMVSGLMAWWRGSKGRVATKDVIQEVNGWFGNASAFLQRLALGLAVAVVLLGGLALAMVLVDWLVDWLLRTFTGPSKPSFIWYLGVAAAGLGVIALLNLCVDFNTLSLHYFYRDRLIDAFLVTVARPAKRGPSTSPEVKRDHGEIRLCDLHGRAPGAPGGTAATAAPYHLYNACLNLTTERDLAYRSRKSDIFIFSKLYCGSETTGFVQTKDYRAGGTKVARAMTISGAAADSAMGCDTFFAQAFGLTLFNIRLGQWMENPGYHHGQHANKRENGVFWPRFLVMETLGMSDARHRLMHLSDGAHTGDNLGLVSLLRRRCRLILAIDAETDPKLGFGSLMNALQYAEADLGIRIDIHLGDLHESEARPVVRHYAVGTISYPAQGKAPAASGYLIVLKSSVHAGDAETVLKYRAAHPAFPHETTLNQFFPEGQFEAYRKLGQNMADQLLKEHPELDQGRIA